MDYFMEKEVFVECGDGWRWRFHITDDAGLFAIEYQDWDAENKQWVPKGPADQLHCEAYALIIDAIRTICEQHKANGR